MTDTTQNAPLNTQTLNTPLTAYQIFKNKQAEEEKLFIDAENKEKQIKKNTDKELYLKTCKDLISKMKVQEIKDYHMKMIENQYDMKIFEEEEKQKEKKEDIVIINTESNVKTEEYVLTQSQTIQETFYTKPFIKDYSQYLLKTKNRFMNITAKNPSLIFNTLDEDLKDYFIKSINITRRRKLNLSPFNPYS